MQLERGAPLAEWLPNHLALMRAEEPDPDGPPYVPSPVHYRPLLGLGLLLAALVAAVLLLFVLSNLGLR